jgi:hypothetical protein
MDRRANGLYTEAANHAMLSRRAMDKLAGNENRTDAPAPDERCGPQRRKKNDFNHLIFKWWER